MTSPLLIAHVGSGIAARLFDCAHPAAHTLQGHVHSVFDKACNITCSHDELFCLLHHDVQRVPWGCVLQEPMAAFSDHIAQGDAFYIRKGQLIMPRSGLYFSFIHASIWNAALCISPCHPTQQAKQFVQHALCQAGWQGFGQHHEYILDYGLTERLQQAAKDMIMALHELLYQPDFSDKYLYEASQNLLGLGPGLTPSGDDFLVGVLAGLHCYDLTAKQQTYLQTWRAWLAQKAAQQTHPVAATYLKHACLGAFSEHLHEIVQALCLASPQKLFEDAVKNMLDFGATSGADTLYGLLGTMRVQEKGFAALP